MSYYGKTFKKAKFENLEEFLEKNEIPEKTRAIFRNTESLTRFDKNDDGTLQYTSLTKDGAVKLTQKIVLNTESDFTIPDGIPGKLFTRLEGDTPVTTLTLETGFVLRFKREYKDNVLKQFIYRDNDDLKLIIYYEEV